MQRYTNVCRICLKEDGIKIQIFGDEGEYRRVAEKMKDCLNLVIYPEDPLPKQICNKCYYMLDLASELMTQCHRSNAIFIHQLSTQRGHENIREYLRLVQDRPLIQVAPSRQQKTAQKRKAPVAADDVEPGPSKEWPILDRLLSKSPRRSSNELGTSTEDLFHRAQESPSPSTSESLKCFVCNQTFTSKKMLLTHQAMHSKEENLSSTVKYDYMCNICGRTFERPKSLKMHSIKYHKVRLTEVTPRKFIHNDIHSLPQVKSEPVDESYECTICYRLLDSDELLNQHFNDEHREMLSPSRGGAEIIASPECIFCFQTFKKSSGLVNHLRTFHGKPSCSICLEIFNTQEELSQHRQFVHRSTDGTESPAQMATDEDDTTTDTVKSTNENFVCHICGKAFDKHISFVRHGAYHTKMKNLGNSGHSLLDVLSSKQGDNSNQDESNLHQTKPQLIRVKSVESNGEAANCLYCKKVYDTSKKLWEHLRKVHPNRPRHKCNTCSRVFFVKKSFISHLNSKLNNKCQPLPVMPVDESSSGSCQPTKCKICHKTFSTKSNMLRHVEVRHNTYTCNKCEHKFNSKLQFDSHICPSNKSKCLASMCTTKRKISVYPKVLCKYCPKYLSKKYINDHEKIHRFAGHKPVQNKVDVTSNVIVAPSTKDVPSSTASSNNEREILPAPAQVSQKKKAFCKYCDFISLDFHELRKHLLKKHANQEYHFCQQCPEVYFDMHALKSHMYKHNRKYNNCKYCARSFAYFQTFLTHERTCENRPTNKKGPQNKAAPKPASTKTNDDPKEQGSPPGPTIYTCDYCGSQFLNTQEFTLHLKNHVNNAV